MRLDKYLRVSHLIEQHTVANETCDAGRVMVDGKTARALREVKEGDVLELQLGTRSLKVHVVRVSEHAPKGEASETCEAVF